MQNNYKKCSICEEEKLQLHYYKNRNQCKDCYKERYGYIKRKRIENLKIIPNQLTSNEKKKLLEQHTYTCMLTGETTNITLDHFVPVILGEIATMYGIGGTTYENLIPITSKLNKSKASDNPFEWIKKAKVKHGIDMNKWNYTVKYLADKNKLSILEYKNRIDSCFIHYRIKNWVENLNYQIVNNSEEHTRVLLALAINRCININVAVETYGSLVTKKYIKDEKEYLENLKARRKKLFNIKNSRNT